MLYRRSYWMSPFAFAWWLLRVFFSIQVIVALVFVGFALVMMNSDKVFCTLSGNDMELWHKPCAVYSSRGWWPLDRR